MNFRCFFLVVFAILSFQIVKGEGTKQMRPDSTTLGSLRVQSGGGGYSCFATSFCTPDEKMYVRIAHPGEKIYLGFHCSFSIPLTLTIRLNGTPLYTIGPLTQSPGTPGYIQFHSQACIGPDILNPQGYPALTFVPLVAGDYDIELTTSTLDLFDVTVIDTTLLPLTPVEGRLWSKSWAFDTGNISSSMSFCQATQYILTDDSIVTSLWYNGMQGHLFDVSCNQNGCYPPPASWDTSCMSHSGGHHYPEYKIFMNDPDHLEFPTGSLGSIIPGTFTATSSCDGIFEISFSVNKSGNVQLYLEINPIPGQQPEDVTLMGIVIPGVNTLTWNGLNGLGVPVAAGTAIGIYMEYINGLTNFPVFDVERNLTGFMIGLVRPQGPPIATYWNDTLLVNKGGRTQLAGCYNSPPNNGCHAWTGGYGGNGIGSFNTVNTWWYAASSKTIEIQLPVKRYPATPSELLGPVTVCQSDTGTYSIIPHPLPDADTNGFEWILTQEGTGTVLFDSINRISTISIPFASFPSGDKRLKVRGSNGVCSYGLFGPGSAQEGMLISVDPFPIPALGPDTTLCTGQSITFDAGYCSGCTFQWSNLATGQMNIGTTQTYNATTAGIYLATVTGPNSCKGRDTVTVTLGQPLTIGISIAASSTNLCDGSVTTFTATTINSGSSPLYQWKVNGVNAGTNNPVFTYAPANGDIVTCVLTSSLTSCISGNPVISNTITITVNPNLPVSISIMASATQVCAGTTVDFTATANNGGATPIYQWKVNAVNAINANNTVYNYTPLNGDVVTCSLLSSETCASGNPALSDPVTMVVNANLPVGIIIAASANPFCTGSVVTFTATPVNGGTNPGYQWRVNGINAINANNAVFSYSPANGDSVWCVITSNLNCVTGSPASSAKIIMIGLLVPNVAFSACFDTVTSVNAKPFKLRGGLPLGGTYSGPGVNSSTGMFTPSVAGTGMKTITYSYINVHDCSASKSKSILVQTNPSFTCGSNFVDTRDNKVYPTVLIGAQCWMAANLNFGITISDLTPQTDNCTPEKYTRPASLVPRPAFYQWDELMQYQTAEGSQGLCPPGWHVPSSAEWNVLLAFLNGAGQAGGVMKDTLLTNGFNSYQNGLFYQNKSWSFITGIYAGSMYWTSTLSGPSTPSGSRAIARGLNENNPSVSEYESLRSNAFSVRCLRD